ncbi:MAG: DMT family transporter [Eubacteriaceae bacterium]|jgi:drug/metabolite transporter (DMT)-like permease|nr:DMT family transporter [Eubacteriaceae bacterium]
MSSGKLKLNRTTASLLLIVASFFWGSSFVASKICLNSGLNQFEIVFYRFALGALLTLIIFHKQMKGISKAAVRTGFFLGLITSCTFTVEMFGLTLTQTTKAAFLTSTNLVIMPFLYWIFCRVRPGKNSIIAAFITLIGVGFLTLTHGFGSFQLGDGLMLFDACTYCFNTIVMLKTGETSSRVQISFFQFATTAAVMGVLTLFQGTSGTMPHPALIAILYMALLPTTICFIIKNVSLDYVNPIQVNLILATESTFCAIVSVILLHDVITPRMLIGIIIIITGILIEILHPTWKRGKGIKFTTESSTYAESMEAQKDTE